MKPNVSIDHTPGDRPARIRLTFVAQGASVEAEMLWDRAPATCAAVASALPSAAVSHHAAYSGSEGVMLLPEVIRLEPENATWSVAPGDVGFTWFAAGSASGVDRDFAEICWFYAPDARPSMHEGPVPVSIFARMVGDTSEFVAACRRMRRRGVTPMVVETVVRSVGPTHIRIHDPADEAGLGRRPAEIGASLYAVGAGLKAGCCSLLRSTDGGASWSHVSALGSTFGSVNSASVAIVSPDRMVCVASVGLEEHLVWTESDDGGRTWGQDRECLANGASPHAAVTADGAVCAAYSTTSGLGLAILDNDSDRWTALDIPLPARAYRPSVWPLAGRRLAIAHSDAPRANATRLVIVDLQQPAQGAGWGAEPEQTGSIAL